MCIYIYIVYFIAFKFKANCLGECSYVSRRYRNYVLCSRTAVWHDFWVRGSPAISNSADWGQKLMRKKQDL